MSNATLQNRIKLLDPGHREPQNCVGAGLFLLGLIKYEHYVQVFEAYKFLKDLDEVESLDETDLIVFEEPKLSAVLEHPWVTHMAVIVEKSPLKIMHRVYSMGAEINKGKPEYHMNSPFTEVTLENLQEQFQWYNHLKLYALRL